MTGTLDVELLEVGLRTEEAGRYARQSVHCSLAVRRLVTDDEVLADLVERRTVLIDAGVTDVYLQTVLACLSSPANHQSRQYCRPRGGPGQGRSQEFHFFEGV